MDLKNYIDALENCPDGFKEIDGNRDKRGIWTVIHFYNIHVSPAFANAHAHEGVKVMNPASTPLLGASIPADSKHLAFRHGPVSSQGRISWN